LCRASLTGAKLLSLAKVYLLLIHPISFENSLQVLLLLINASSRIIRANSFPFGIDIKVKPLEFSVCIKPTKPQTHIKGKEDDT